MFIKKRTKLLLLVLAGLGNQSIASPSAIIPSNSSIVKTAANIIKNERPSYRFGASGGFSGKYDCSSFVMKAAERAALADLPRDSRSQFELLSGTSKVWLRGSRGWEDLRPGDLIFFSGTYRHDHDNPISHVMIYAGENQMIGAQSSGVGLFDFTPTAPQGKPGADPKSVYKKKTVYAYVRPNWSRTQTYLAMNSPAKRPNAGGEYIRATGVLPSPSRTTRRVEESIAVPIDEGEKVAQVFRTIYPSNHRGVWLPPGEE
jgi:hypothetical protein